jgi:putative transposase
VRYEFIDKQLLGFPKRSLFRLLEVDKSSFYRWVARRSETNDGGLEEKVAEVFWRHSRRYGSRRIAAELRAEGVKVGRHRVRRLMAQQGLRAIQPRSFVPRTTDSRHGLGYSPNLLLELKLPPATPLAVIVGDITYLPLQNGEWAYLATWTDLFSRRILGWAVRAEMTEELIVEAFRMLLSRVKLPPGCIVHSDRGGQYASKRFRRLLRAALCRQSMSRAGETYDNAYAESLFSRYKAELLENGAFSDTEEARLESFQYIEGYYNRIRRHSSLGYQSPLDFENAYYQSTKEEEIDKSKEKGVKVKQHKCPTF